MQKRIILTNIELPQRSRSRLDKSAGHHFEILKADDASEEDYPVIEVLLFDGGSNWLTPERLKAMKNLRLLQNVSAGVDHLDFSVIPEPVIVCGNVGAYAEQMAEFVFGMILYFGKHLQEHYENLRRGVFAKRPKSLFLNGKTIGILGAGGIGQAVAKIAKAYGMSTVGVNPSGKGVDGFDEMGTLRDLDRVLAVSAVIVVALPLNLGTYNLITKNELTKMKDDAILVNVARGKIISEADLFEHLKTHPNFRMATDVWWKYPKKEGEPFFQNFPFFDLPNFLGTPHVSGVVPEEAEIAVDLAVENVLSFLRGGAVRGVVNRKDYVGLRS